MRLVTRRRRRLSLLSKPVMYPSLAFGFSQGFFLPRRLTTGSAAHCGSSRRRFTVSATTSREYAMFAMTVAASSSDLGLASDPSPSTMLVYLRNRDRENEKLRDQPQQQLELRALLGERNWTGTHTSSSKTAASNAVATGLPNFFFTTGFVQRRSCASSIFSNPGTPFNSFTAVP